MKKINGQEMSVSPVGDREFFQFCQDKDPDDFRRRRRGGAKNSSQEQGFITVANRLDRLLSTRSNEISQYMGLVRDMLEEFGMDVDQAKIDSLEASLLDHEVGPERIEEMIDEIKLLIRESLA